MLKQSTTEKKHSLVVGIHFTPYYIVCGHFNLFR